MLATTPPFQPIVRRLPADLETPLGVYLKIAGEQPAFLFESVEGGAQVGRYSFVGCAPRAVYRVRGQTVEKESAGQTEILHPAAGQDPLHVLATEMAPYRAAHVPNLPRFIGGLVGYVGYEAVRYFEPTLAAALPAPTLPEAIFLLIDTCVVFDHAEQTLSLIAFPRAGGATETEARLDALAAQIVTPLPPQQAAAATATAQPTATHSQPAFEKMVTEAKERITAGDIFQIVLSQRLELKNAPAPLAIYRQLRRINPSPYLFYLNFGAVDGQPLVVTGSSPELFLRLENGVASQRPIAGTRPRGADSAADERLAAELRADPKELAEHAMLVDLARNDLGRVCAYGSVRVTENLQIEKYSHVMHLVSQVEGRLADGLTAFDLLRACLPAGTVSGAPKVRAMQLIAAAEKTPRNVYGGAIGYISFDGSLDTCLAIRTLTCHGDRVSIQAGAGVVAASQPAREYAETLQKASAALKAVQAAGVTNF